MVVRIHRRSSLQNMTSISNSATTQNSTLELLSQHKPCASLAPSNRPDLDSAKLTAQSHHLDIIANAISFRLIKPLSRQTFA
jgi:hypothetical protein